MLDMIKCSTGGAYYARGEWVPADGEASAALAAKRALMPQPSKRKDRHHGLQHSAGP